MRVLKVNRFWPALAVAFGAALVIVTAASADTGLATATVAQTSAGTRVNIECAPGVPGFLALGEAFSGPFTDVSGKSKESKLLEKSSVAVEQNATVCVIGYPDAYYNVPFAGSVYGTATISRHDSSGKNVLGASYGSPIAGTLNLLTGAINVTWQPGGQYVITDVAGKFAKSFTVGEANAATATASSKGLGAPESGVLQISFDFEPKN